LCRNVVPCNGKGKAGGLLIRQLLMLEHNKIS
jgi:hypothetical protein